MMKTHLALALFGALPLAAQAPATAAKQADFSFPNFLYGDGRQKLSDFFGQPVMVEEWGVH
jgi:hypothetical protein